MLKENTWILLHKMKTLAKDTNLTCGGGSALQCHLQSLRYKLESKDPDLVQCKKYYLDLEIIGC